uniref:Uncharacterized protein n=1 Tax=Acrobeloides nanus TaxID=290746 RepID=A0A914CIK0_9BILA
MIFGLYDWLSEPTNDPNHCCQCPRLKYRKIIFLVLLLILVGVLGVLSFLLWHAFDFALPRIIIGVITILEVATLLVAVPAFINEKHFWLLPFIGTQILACLTWVVLIVIYLVILIKNQIEGTGGEVGNVQVFLPGVPSTGLGDTSMLGYNQNQQIVRILGHLFLLLMVQLYIGYTMWAAYRIFRSRNGANITVKYAKAKKYPHNVVVLEQNVDEAIYGKRSKV